ncbi:MAG: AraC family transcriptional regulator, partial [Planctomycetota bacterium]
GPREVVCDPNTVLFIGASEPYQLAHPVPLANACTALYVYPALVADMLVCRNARPPRGLGSFPFDNSPADPRLHVLHRALLQATRHPDPLAVEELGLRLAGRAIETALRFNARRVPRCMRAGTARLHAARVDAVRAYLAVHFRERVTLAGLAARVHCAPHHLCAIFKRATGVSIHRYCTQLRLATAVEELLCGPRRLTELAVTTGFAHHSHFTTVFRREFGTPPSRLAEYVGAAAAHEIRKNLQAVQPERAVS